MERLPVAEPGQRVGVGQPPDRAAQPGRLDRRPRLADDGLERLEVAARDRRLLVAAEHGQEPQVAALRLDRHGDRRPHGRRLHDPCRVVVRDPDGAHPAAVRRAADRSGAGRVASVRRRGRRKPRAERRRPGRRWSPRRRRGATWPPRRIGRAPRRGRVPARATRRCARGRHPRAPSRPSSRARRASASICSPMREAPGRAVCSAARRVRSTIAATMPAATSAATAATSARAAVLIGLS